MPALSMVAPNPNLPPSVGFLQRRKRVVFSLEGGRKEECQGREKTTLRLRPYLPLACFPYIAVEKVSKVTPSFVASRHPWNVFRREEREKNL